MKNYEITPGIVAHSFGNKQKKESDSIAIFLILGHNYVANAATSRALLNGQSNPQSAILQIRLSYLKTL